MNRAVLAVAIDFCVQESSQQFEDEKLNDYVLRVMRRARTFWMDPDPNLVFLAAIAACLASSKPKWRHDISRSAKLLEALSASLKTPVDFDQALAEAGDLETLVPIMSLWHQSKDKISEKHKDD